MIAWMPCFLLLLLGHFTEGAISGKDTKEQGTETTLFVSFGSPSQGLPSEASKSIAETAEAEDGLWMSVAEIGPPRLVFFLAFVSSFPLAAYLFVVYLDSVRTGGPLALFTE